MRSWIWRLQVWLLFLWNCLVCDETLHFLKSWPKQDAFTENQHTQPTHLAADRKPIRPLGPSHFSSQNIIKSTSQGCFNGRPSSKQTWHWNMVYQQKWSFLSQEEKVHRCCSANKKCFLHVFTLLYLSNYFVECFQGVTHILSADISPCLWGFLQHLSQFQSASGARNHIFVTQIPLYLTVFIYIYTIYIHCIYIYTLYIYIYCLEPHVC